MSDLRRDRAAVRHSPYAIQWIRPNQFGKFSALNGEYTFIPDGSVDSDGLLRIIREARFVEPREFEPEERRLAGR